MFRISINYQTKVLIKKLYKIFLYLLLICSAIVGTGNDCHPQENVHNNNEKHGNGFHKLTGVMAYAFVDNSFSDETNQILIVPAVGFNYDYIFKRGWGVGLHSELILQQFKAESHGDEEELVRENPFALVGMALYKPHHRWTLMAGYGVEFEKHKSFQIIRIGLDYGVALPKDWELGFSLEFDFKPDAYNSLLFGVGFSKLFGSKSKDIHQ